MRSACALLLAVPVGALEARLGLGARLAKEPVVAIEAVEHRPRDGEGARVGECDREGRCRRAHRPSRLQHAARRALVREHLVERRAQVGQARFEVGALAREHVDEAAQLALAVALGLVHVDQLLHLRELEAESLAAQREREPGAVARREDALPAGARRRDQAAVFVETGSRASWRPNSRASSPIVKVAGTTGAGRCRARRTAAVPDIANYTWVDVYVKCRKCRGR